jgi:nucleoside-diphosphate-sugar epimerase
VGQRGIGYIPAMSTGQETVLVTGANGFVGSRLCAHLIEQGFRVIAQVRKTSNLTLLEHLDLEYRYGDVTSPETLPELVAGADRIVHNAGLISARRREQFFAVNEQGTRNLCEAVRDHNPSIKRLVCVSSVAAAGPSQPGRPVRESDEPHPITTYGESKLAGEKVARLFADEFSVVVVRPPAVFGPGDRGIYSIFKTIHLHLRPLIGHGDRRLQLVYVDDLCRGIVAALTAEVASGEVYFIADHQSYSYRRLIDMMVKACERWTIPLVLPKPLFRLIAAISEFSFKAVGATPLLTREKTRELNASWEVDVSRARDELGFESQAVFAEAARQTYQWYLKHGWL